ncbi:MAG: DNA-binding response regulator [Sphingopyxis sp.]|jgi:two-component system response regulator TctD|nr:DNA-binding response regulator [Sphingopyxis sp.]
MRLLVVEDDEDLGFAVSNCLRQDGYAVDWERDGEVAEEILRYQSYDVIVLDIGLPGIDGISILKSLRARADKTPVLVLTARSAIDDRIDALDLGADDYLAKPFDVREFLARCRALLRRSKGGATDRIEMGGFLFDGIAKTVKVDDTQILLPNREFRLLEILLRSPGRVLDKDQIAEQLFDFDHETGPNAIEVYVARLRKKLAGGITIKTVRGLGYVVEPVAAPVA